MRAGIKFFLSSNGVILTKGDDTGFLRPEFFRVVTDADGIPLAGWNRLPVSPESQTPGDSRERPEQHPEQPGSEAMTTTSTNTKVGTDMAADGNSSSLSQNTRQLEVT